MCRLLGFATAGSNTNLNGVLGMQNVRDFRNLSEIHNDGWGAALITVPDESPYRRDGGAPTPETGTAIYKNTIAARHDPIFDELANTPARGGLWHLRLASSNLPLILENQQPFYANGLSFIHNGDISDDRGRNIITNRAFPVDPSIVQSTGGRSDSAIFFAVILQYIGFGFALDEAVAQAVRELRKSYPKSSYNCMIQSRTSSSPCARPDVRSRPSASSKSTTSTVAASRRATIACCATVRSAETTISRRAWSWPAPVSTSAPKTAGPASKTTR